MVANDNLYFRVMIEPVADDKARCKNAGDWTKTNDPFNNPADVYQMIDESNEYNTIMENSDSNRNLSHVYELDSSERLNQIN